ncbi:LPXTG cell wall anchor domain-containing protein [Herbiconiux sp. VKM Ac-2851]|uniref:LPXTG cell wall anchor domain-containing protein n=1 Tax=Herbiconiux sp. VKM Ac-2851 TaxID=2739025 RepID=UPI0015651B42|nr:LPXTG cell wall anchor domain-containing protein [Herbiconiux sp. VKM Ac-2851]NQX37131.1 LPXTG cell wall anchor domain-containing protein [Herbiconiux sp. VKM Ac-2851]
MLVRAALSTVLLGTSVLTALAGPTFDRTEHDVTGASSAVATVTPTPSTTAIPDDEGTTQSLEATASSAVPGACVSSDVDPGIPAADFGDIAQYSTTPLAQGVDCTGFRAYLSTGLPQYDSQSFEFFGELIGSDGSENSVAIMSQGNPLSWVDPALPVPITVEEAGLIFNRLDENAGPVIGGIDGLALPDLPPTTATADVSIGYQPWSIDVAGTTGTEAETISMTAISGAPGAVGTTYELTAVLATGYAGHSTTEPTTFTAVVNDPTGIVQWGYGPNGFFPLWMFDGTPVDGIATNDQRDAIMNEYGGDIGAYLTATNDPMTGQGSQYYSMPVLNVEQWSVTRGESYVGGGTSGTLWFDNLTETYNETADHVVRNGYQWTEFSMMLPDTGQGLLIAKTSQADVGNLYYAMLAGADSTQNANGTLAPTANWPQAAIEVEAVPGSEWTSPQSCYVYTLADHVTLAAVDGRPAVDVVLSAVDHPDQEINALGRPVYEGLFSYTGTIDGQAVSGKAWGEIQGTPPTDDCGGGSSSPSGSGEAVLAATGQDFTPIAPAAALLLFTGAVLLFGLRRRSNSAVNRRI